MDRPSKQHIDMFIIGPLWEVFLKPTSQMLELLTESISLHFHDYMK